MHARGLILRALLVAPLAVAIFATGCSSTTNGDLITFDLEGGDELARRMLPDPAVLPGTGWRFTAGSDDEDGPDDAESTPGSCRQYESFFDELPEALNNPAGAADGEYTLAASDRNPLGIPLSITVEVEIHEDRKLVQEALRAFDEVLNSDDFEECMREAAQTGVDEGEPLDGFEFSLEKTAPSAEAPRSGSELALAGQMSFASIEVDFRMEFYAWRIGNAIEFVFFVGSEDDITPDFVRTALNRFDGAAVIAAKQ